MHSSSKIKNTDFEITWRGTVVTHADFFSSFCDTDRIGIVIPHRLEGVGAAALIMAYVTAFYDRYRERGGEFFAYPDFFTFQHESPCANYGNLDVWPDHKNVLVPRDAQQTIEAITDRGVNVLLVPDNDPVDPTISPVELASAQRNIQQCFAYSESGSTTSADLVITCRNQMLGDYALGVFNSVPADDLLLERRQQWQQQIANGTLSQSFRELDLGEALLRL